MSRLSKGISATWWYTFSGVLMFQLVVALIWSTMLVNAAEEPITITIIGVAGLLWCASSVPLLLQYRHRDETAGLTAGRRSTLVPLAVAVAFAVAAGIVSGLWLAAAVPLVQTLALLNWPPGVRVRLVIAVTVLLAGLWFIDTRTADLVEQTEAIRTWWMVGVFTIMLPSMTVLSLWWWDVVITIDRARIAEARLSATQERLRVATDVHDLQGHHLQVIALQLELAERLLTKGESDAALEQLRLARTSVTDARQGTRDLATRFRGVPLPDEIANAVDLLRAAGTTADATIDPHAAGAPASVLGPVIRETTTNILKHGGGEWARLSLRRENGSWRYEITNDAASDRSASDDGAGLDGTGLDNGAGLDGIARRVAEVGGSAEVRREAGEFTVIVRVPADAVIEERA